MQNVGARGNKRVNYDGGRDFEKRNCDVLSSFVEFLLTEMDNYEYQHKYCC
jgi:hypothetical protein